MQFQPSAVELRGCSKQKKIKEINEYFKNATGKERQATADAAIAERKRNAEAARAGRGERVEQNGDNVESAKENAGVKKGKRGGIKGDRLGRGLSQFVSGVELYDNTARSLSGLDSSLQSRGTSDGIVAAKLRQFFEDAKKGGRNRTKKRKVSASELWR